MTMLCIRVCWYCTWGIETHTHFPQEVICERVTVCYHKGPGVENHLLVDIKVVHIVKLVIIRSWERNAMTVNKCSCMEREWFNHGSHRISKVLSCKGVTLWYATIF